MFKIALKTKGQVALFISPSALKRLEIIAGKRMTILDRKIIFL